MGIYYSAKIHFGWEAELDDINKEKLAERLDLDEPTDYYSARELLYKALENTDLTHSIPRYEARGKVIVGIEVESTKMSKGAGTIESLELEDFTDTEEEIGFLDSSFIKKALNLKPDEHAKFILSCHVS